MPNRLFQNAINSLKGDLDRNICVVDDGGVVVSCSDEKYIGTGVPDRSVVSDATGEVRTRHGYSYKRAAEQGRGGYVVFCEGEDEQARSYCSFFCMHFATVKQYYDEKYDRNSFVKNIMLDNILSGDITYRGRELRLDAAPRVVFIVRTEGETENVVAEILGGIFPDSERDFVVVIGDSDVAVVKSFDSDPDEEETTKLARLMMDTLTSESLLKFSIGISTVKSDITELSTAYREARTALEVGKVFDTENDIVSYSNLGIGRIIYQLPTTLCELFLKEVFKKESINILDSETIYTIQKFFENSLNLSETARKLFVHRNTLVYRLDKIKKLTGLDLREFDDAVTFKVAMMVNKYLTNNTERL